MSNSPKVTRAKILGSDWLFCFISICRFGINLSKLYFRFKRFILLVQSRKLIFMSYEGSINSWKPWIWVKLDFIFKMRDIYINCNPNPLTKFTSSNRSTDFKDILPWNISQMNTKTTSISTTIIISYPMKQGFLFWVWRKDNGDRDNNKIKFF